MPQAVLSLDSDRSRSSRNESGLSPQAAAFVRAAMEVVRKELREPFHREFLVLGWAQPRGIDACFDGSRT